MKKLKYICRTLILGFEIFTLLFFATAIPIIWIVETSIITKTVKILLCLFVIGVNTIFITDDIKKLQR